MTKIGHYTLPIERALHFRVPLQSLHEGASWSQLRLNVPDLIHPVEFHVQLVTDGDAPFLEKGASGWVQAANETVNFLRTIPASEARDRRLVLLVTRLDSTHPIFLSIKTYFHEA